MSMERAGAEQRPALPSTETTGRARHVGCLPGPASLGLGAIHGSRRIREVVSVARQMGLSDALVQGALATRRMPIHPSCLY